MFEINDPASTMEQALKDDEEFQRKQTEKLHNDLPGIIAALSIEEESFQDDSDVESPGPPKQNGGMYQKTNGHHVENGHEREKELLLDVRSREVKKLQNQLAEASIEMEALQKQLDRASMEKQRAILSLKDSQEQMEKLKDIQQERDEYWQQVQSQNEDVRMLKMTIADQDKMIRLLTDATHDNQKMSQRENELEALKQKHDSEISNLNHQLELSLQKCKSFEKDNFELEKKIKYVEGRTDDIITQKNATVSKLMTQIQELEDKLLRKSTSDVYDELKQNLMAARAVEHDLRAELSVKEILEKHLRNDLAALRAQMESREKLKTTSVEQSKTTSIKKVNEAGAQTDAWSVDDNNAQYLRFHEEQMANLRQQSEARRLADLLEKDKIIERLRVEIEEVQRKYLSEIGDTIDARKLQEELATATERLMELRQIHSENCVPELENRAEQINDLQNQVGVLSDRLSASEKAEKLLQEKLAKVCQDKEEEIARFVADLKAMQEKNVELQQLRKTISPGKKTAETRVYTDAEMTKILEDIARRHLQETNKYESIIEELKLKLSNQLPQPDSRSNELIVELWRKLQHIQTENADFKVQISKLENNLQQTTEKLNEAHGKAAQLKSEILNGVDKCKKVCEKFKAMKEYYYSRLTELRRNRETEKKKWEKERARWELERKLYNKGKTLWETERVKREEALLDLISQIDRLKPSPPQETVNALMKLYEDVQLSIKRLQK